METIKNFAFSLVLAICLMSTSVSFAGGCAPNGSCVSVPYSGIGTGMLDVAYEYAFGTPAMSAAWKNNLAANHTQWARDVNATCRTSQCVNDAAKNRADEILIYLKRTGAYQAYDKQENERRAQAKQQGNSRQVLDKNRLTKEQLKKQDEENSGD